MEPSPPANDSYNATLRQRLDITPRLAIFRIHPDEGTLPFTPGQFTVLGLRADAPRVEEADPELSPPPRPERLLRRAYSISSGSQSREHLEFYISLVNSGELTPRLFALQPGDRLWVGAKSTGMFTLDRVPPGRGILLVATGTGLAPYVSMIRTQVAGLQCPTHPIAVIHGASTSWDLGYRGELEEFQRRCPHLRYLPVVSRPEADPDWQGRTGHLQRWLQDPDLEEAIGMTLHPDLTHVFLCGHPGMVEEAQGLLADRGYQPGRPKTPGSLHLEKYW